VTFLQVGFGECEKCGRKFEPDDLHDLLTPARHPKEYYDEGPIHCANCEGYDTVIEQGEGYFCTSCFEEYDRSDLEQCSWCGEYNAGGDMEDSEWSGCTACEGRGGWDKDD
jgi:hypothetical protein